MHAAFHPALPLSKPPILPLSRCSRNLSPVSPRAAPLHPARTTIRSAWEDTLLPEPTRPPPTPSSTHTLHLLSLSATHPLAYATATPLSTPRKPYATNSSALPLPYTPAESPIITHALAHLTCSPCPPSRAPPTLPSQLLQALHVSRADCAPVFSGNTALGALHVICAAGATLETVVVEEAPSTAFELCAVLLLRVPAGTVCGELVYRTCEVVVTPGFGVAVGNVAGVDVVAEKSLYDAAAVAVEDMVRVYEARGAVPVVEKPGAVLEETPDADGGTEEVAVPWELTAADVDALSDTALRTALRRYGVGVTLRDSRETLLRKYVLLMDEVQRRELGVLLAAREGMYALAGELQAGRSKRGSLLAELKQAETQGNWGDVMRLGMRIRRLENGIMDVTAEPGSYDKDLDRDEWYQPNR